MSFVVADGRLQEALPAVQPGQQLTSMKRVDVHLRHGGLEPTEKVGRHSNPNCWKLDPFGLEVDRAQRNGNTEAAVHDPVEVAVGGVEEVV